MKIAGWPAVTLSRGKPVWQDGEFCGKAGQGEFLRCSLPAPAKPRPRDATSFTDFSPPDPSPATQL
jgi:hypothetical protein